MKKLIVIYRTLDPLELPVNIVETIEDAACWIGCSVKTLYNNMSIYGTMKAKGYSLELVEDVEE